MIHHLERYLLMMPVLAVAPMATAATASRAVFGTMSDGSKVYAVTLDDGHGFAARVISLGAALQSLTLPDRDGKYADVVLAYSDLREYLTNPQYFGASVGRYANRIAKGRFTLNGKPYQLSVNDHGNTLHGGKHGFNMVNWKILKIVQGPDPSVTMQYISPDGDQGFPGKLTATATYTLKANHKLEIDYTATTDAPTIVNITNHAYWNLGGEGSGSVMDDLLTIPADEITPTDATQIPTGKFMPVAGTDFDFRKSKPIGRDIRDGRDIQLMYGHGYDMNWVISRRKATAPRLVAKVVDPHSGRVLELYSEQPGLQFYSGNFLDGTTLGPSKRTYRQGDAFVLEPQMFPDTPNHPNFGSAVLLPGQTYHNDMTYVFSVEKEPGD